MTELFRYELACAVDIRPEIELHEDNGNTGRRVRAYAEYTGSAVHRSFNRQTDERFDLFGSHAVRFREDRDCRRGQVRKNVHRRSQCHDSAVDQQDGCSDDDD